MNNIDQNELAVWVTKQEGGAVNLSIAQVKEVVRLTFVYLALWLDLHGEDGEADVVRMIYDMDIDEDVEPI